ncbi:MAG: hypothetical protein GTN70_05870 [Deltaproteobacteria bacterium]|nr:hypothetical protein [Deltaproteobacteria bacterium]NIS77206.1 hypothetical protein [Deltaproteobacteria bacterium]
MRKIVPVTLFIVVILISGCATKWKAYPGPELPKEEIAITGCVSKVDGETKKATITNAVEVLPGEQLDYWYKETLYNILVWTNAHMNYVHLTDIPVGYYDFLLDFAWMERNEHIRPQKGVVDE